MRHPTSLPKVVHPISEIRFHDDASLQLVARSAESGSRYLLTVPQEFEDFLVQPTGATRPDLPPLGKPALLFKAPDRRRGQPGQFLDAVTAHKERGDVLLFHGFILLSNRLSTQATERLFSILSDDAHDRLLLTMKWDRGE